MPVPPLLYACRDNLLAQSYRTRGGPFTILNAVVIGAQGAWLQLGVGQSQYFIGGADYQVYVSYGGIALVGRITANNPAAEQTFFLPFNDFDSNPQLADGWSIPAGAGLLYLRGFNTVELPIDLSEAPPGNYRYLILAQGTMVSFGATGQVEQVLEVNGRPGSPHHLDARPPLQQARVAIANQRASNYFGATSLIIRGGDTRSIFLRQGMPGASAAANAATANNGRIAAIRVDQSFFFAYASGTGFTAAALGTEYTITEMTVPSTDNWMVVANWFEGADGGAGHNQTFLEVVDSGGTRQSFWAWQYQACADGDRRPVGAVHYLSLTAGWKVRIRFTGYGATPKVDNWFLAMFLLPPGMRAVSAALTQTVTSVGDSATQIASGTLTLPVTGRYLEFVSFVANNVPTGSQGVNVRPRFQADPPGYYGTPRGWHYREPVTGQFTTACFFHRTKRAAGPSSIYLDAWNAIAGAGSTAIGVTAQLPLYVALQIDEMPPADAEQVVTAKVETAYWFRRWSAHVDPDSFAHSLPMGSRISRIIWNGTEMTRVSHYGMLTGSSQYSHDEEAASVRIRLGAGQSPSDANQVLLVCLWLHAATDPVTLIERDFYGWDAPQPYRARLVSEPSYSQEVSADGTGATSSATMGEIALAAVDGHFDPDIRKRRVDGLRTIVRRGPRSDLREAQHQVQLVATNGGHVLDEELTIRLYSSLIDLRRPLTEQTWTIYQAGIARTGVLVPIVFGWGRVAAYLTNWAPGAANTSIYRVTAIAFGIEVFGNVFLTAEQVNAPSQVGITKDPNNAGLGIVNTWFADPNNPPDVVYAEVWGTRSIPGDSASRGLRFPGEIARAIMRMGNVPAGEIDEQSFIDYDRIWRRRLSGGATIPAPPKVGVYFNETISIGDAVAQTLAQAFGIRSELPAGRVNAGVLDFSAQQLATNPGFESSGTDIWPWVGYNALTSAVTTSPTYEGTRAVEISNGGNAYALLFQTVSMRKPGFAIAASLLAALKTGIGMKVRVAVVRPSDGYDPKISPAFELTNTAWKRLVHWMELDEDEVGTTTIGLFPAFNDTASLSILVDNFEIWPVAVVSRNRRTETLSEEDEEAYFQARVQVSVNPLAALNPAVLLTDGDLAGAATSYAKFASPGSGRADFGTETVVADSDSAAGIAAAVVRYFSQPRFRLRTTELIGWRRPAVGDVLLDDSAFRKVIGSDEMPIYSIRRVAVQKSMRTVEIEAETRTPLISDSLEIAPQKVPLGLILISTDGTCPTDWQPYTAPQNYYLTGAYSGGGFVPGQTAGAWRHSHSLAHTHTVQAHTHTISSIGIGAVPAGDELATNAVIGPAFTPVARQDHTHTNPSGSWATGAMTGSGVSSQPNSAISTIASGNAVTSLRVRLCKKTAHTVEQVPVNLAFFSESATAPGGYTRATTLDSQVPRVETGIGAVATTTTGAHTPGTATASFTVAATTNLHGNQILKITSGGSSYYGVLTGLVGSTVTVDVLNYQGDVTGVSYPSGATVTAFSGVAGTTETVPATHSHGGTVPSHQHNETHAHSIGASVDITGLAAGTTLHRDVPLGTNDISMSTDDHIHTADVQIPNASTQTATAAGGTISAASAPSPDSISLAFHKASAGTQQVATGLGGFVDGALCPPGWVEYGAASKRLLKGAAAGQGLSVMATTHAHATTFDAHSASHNHGGAVPSTYTTAPSAHLGPPYLGGVNTPGVAGGMPYPLYGQDPVEYVHRHALTMSGVSTFAGTLAAFSGTTGPSGGELNMPPVYALRFCVKA
jgi:hypothetical protein